MLLLLSLITFLQFCVVCGDSCRQENVSGGDGGDVILRVHQTGIRFINWVLLPKGDFIVQTNPNESINDNKLTKQYKGRVRSEDDGSLHLYKLSQEDQGIYRAKIQTEDNEDCVEFHLTVYEILSPGDIQINHTISRNDPCSLDLFCSVYKRNVTITWSSVHTSDINVTRGVLYVSPRGVNVTYICTARNPVSNVSKTVIPGEFCKTKSEFKGAARDHLLGALGIISVLVIIFILVAWKPYRQWRKGKYQEAEIITTYAQVGAQQSQQENLYHQRQEEKTDYITLYSEVQHVKNNTPQKKLIGIDAKTVQTVYSEVTIPKE
ncbi:CD48 antigen-like [Hyla sarda]|uniref:CD48 antigen-like n=1 Tax=Hyla sarda TaxID=327740 RepID=UPI0024C41184|nr:CD48 antigen-like [Hyla sarda]XP_056403342.1 CD48 antigen-like [Hyla sarda]